MTTRQQRRQQEREQRKRSKDATPDEIFPPGEPHRPIQSGAEHMIAIMEAIKDALGPNYEITLFVAEKVNPTGGLPRFNYASTANREDMCAVLEAFVQRQRAQGPVLDKINDVPVGHG